MPLRGQCAKNQTVPEGVDGQEVVQKAQVGSVKGSVWTFLAREEADLLYMQEHPFNNKYFPFLFQLQIINNFIDMDIYTKRM